MRVYWLNKWTSNKTSSLWLIRTAITVGIKQLESLCLMTCYSVRCSLCLCQCIYSMFYNDMKNKYCLAIRHLHTSHNTLCLSPKFCITLGFVSSGCYILSPREKLRTMPLVHTFLGEKGALCGICKWRILKNFTKPTRKENSISRP